MSATNLYETDALLGQYLVLHFGSADDVFDGVPGPVEAVGFPTRCVTGLFDPTGPRARALDVGCAVGGSVFELARHCGTVLGIDYSQGFISAARHLQADGLLEASLPLEGTRRVRFTAEVPAGIDRSRVEFLVGDAMNLDPGLAGFDVVLAANLICRLTDPMKFLKRVPSLVQPGGQLLLTTPFTWLSDYTPPERWLGGDRPSFDALHDILAPDFILESRADFPFVIREHARKFQYGVAIGSRWRRR